MFFDQMKRNPRELDGMCLENFIREIVNDETRQIRIQTFGNSKDFNTIRNQFVTDRVKVNNCEKAIGLIVRRMKEKDDDPNKVTKADIVRLGQGIDQLHDYTSEKVLLLHDAANGLQNRLEMLEKKIYDEPQIIMNGIIKDLDIMKTKMANELASLRGQLTEDSDRHLTKE